MKLVLTACGVINEDLKKNTLKLFDKEPKDIHMLYITTAVDGENDSDLSWVDEEFQTILDLGILREHILEYKIGQDIDISKFDAIYMMGGNTFYLMSKIREYHFDEVLKNAINQGTIYIGSSAGSEVIAKSIDASLGFDENIVGLTDFSGLGFINSVIIPHANKRKEHVLEYEETSKYPVIAIENGDGVIISNNGKL